MPVYAYKCRDCGTPLEVHQEFSDAALTVCPVCGGALRKQYGTIGVTFNGSGFYRTDSRGGDSGSTASEAPKEAPKTESKPASTPAPSTSGTSGASTQGSSTPS